MCVKTLFQFSIFQTVFTKSELDSLPCDSNMRLIKSDIYTAFNAAVSS